MFIVRVTDSRGAYTDAVIKIPITGVDDKPVFGNLSNAITEDNGSHAATPVSPVPDVSGKVTASDIDRLDSEQVFSLTGTTSGTPSPPVSGTGTTDDPYVVQGKYGSLTFYADGSYSYKLTENAHADIQAMNDEYSKTESFTIRVGTGHNGTISSESTGSLNIEIKGSNDNPVVTGFNNLTLNTGNSISPTVSVTLTITDRAAGPIDGSYTYTLNAGVNDAANEVFTLHVNGTHAHDTLSTKLVFAINGGAPASFSLFRHGETEAESLDSLLGAAAALPESIAPAYAAAASGNAIGSATFATAAAPGTSAAELSAWTAQSWSEPSTQPSELHDMELVMAKLSMEQGL